MSEHELWMQKALALAQEAADAGEIPVGAVIVKNSSVAMMVFRCMGRDA